MFVQVPLLLAATLGPHALGAFVALEYLSIMFVQVPFALSSASLFKIPSLLRSGNGRAAKGTAWLCVFMSLASGLCCSLAIVTLSGALTLFFSHDGDVTDEVAALLPLMALWQVWYGLSTACFSVLEAAGNQRYILWLKVSSGVLVTIPVGCLMLYMTDVGLLGLLWSMVVGQAVGAMQAFLRIKAIDWASLAAKFRLKTLQVLRSSFAYAGMRSGSRGPDGTTDGSTSASLARAAAGVDSGGGRSGFGEVEERGVWMESGMYDGIAPDGFFDAEEALLEVAQPRFSVLDENDLDATDDDASAADGSRGR